MVEAVKWVGQVIEGQRRAFTVDDQCAQAGNMFLQRFACMYVRLSACAG